VQHELVVCAAPARPEPVLAFMQPGKHRGGLLLLLLLLLLLGICHKNTKLLLPLLLLG
jgi:hypothetical protein